ncbi:MAG: ATP-binding cassette domain-containing protein, partial [Candidatus Binatia bacterium]
MISITGLRKKFQSGDHAVAALQGIDLEVKRGEFFVLLGPSGSGKTTLLRSVAGLEKPDSGEISLDDKMVFSS